MARKQLVRGLNQFLQNLHIEMIFNILLMLPPGVLVKFMSVCKKWRDMIRSPAFVREYLQRRTSAGEDNVLYLCMSDATGMSFNILRDKTFVVDSRLRIPPTPPHWKNNLMIVGSFNGVLCLTEFMFFGFTIYLFNPSIWKYRVILSTSIIDLIHVSGVVLGYAYHSQFNDFKVVRIVQGISTGISSLFGHFIFETRVEVYSLNTDCWKEIEVVSFPWYSLESTSEVVVHESLHWLAIDGLTGEGETVILAFDLREEVFKAIALPQQLPEMEELLAAKLKHISVFKHALSILYYFPGESCQLWAMKEYGIRDSWAILYHVRIDVGIQRPLKFTKRDEMIFTDDGLHVFVFDFKTRVTKIVGVMEPEPSFFGFTNSLALIDEINRPIYGAKTSWSPPPVFSFRDLFR